MRERSKVWVKEANPDSTNLKITQEQDKRNASNTYHFGPM